MIGDDPQVPGLSPNLAQVKAVQEEIWLLFGKAGKKYFEGIDLVPDSALRIIINPFLAKRLSIALNDAIRKYEDTYGLIDDKFSTESVNRPLLRPLRLPLFDSARAAEKTALLLSILKNLGLTVALERSFKISEKTLFANRFLLAFRPNLIKENPREQVLAMGAGMNMPKNFLDTFGQNLPEATSVGFGIEEDEKTCMVKAYLEFQNRYRKALQAKGNSDPYVSHLGFKWDADDNTRAVLAKYTCFPRFTGGDILERIKSFYHHNDIPPYTIMEGVVDLASRKVGGDKFLYIEVNEENNPRSSFDINLYRADLRLQEVFSFLMEMCRHYSIPDEQFMKIYEPVKTQTLGHLSGGMDRNGKDFVTVYLN